MSGYYARSGEPITFQEWVATFESARGDDGQPTSSRHVGRDEVSDPQNREHVVSTVWLGLDHGFGGVPLIFETMVFCEDHDCGWDEWLVRYSTEQQAAEGHATTVAAVRHGQEPPE